MWRDRRNWLALGAVLVPVMLLGTPGLTTAVEVGDKAPDFLAFSTVTEVVRLSDFQGKKHVLLFFFVRAFGSV
jgi:hypothetical protein